MSANQLRVFIGSAMTELRDVREVVDNALNERGIEAFVYEADAGAQPETIIETSLRELRESDIFVGLFWKRFPKVTTLEFKEAQNLPRFVYVRDKETTRESELEDFLKAEVFNLEAGVSYDFFDSALKLGKQIADDIMAWLVRRHREMTAELATSRVSLDEQERLRKEVDRLQAASRDPLPQGTEADRLAHDLRGWFETLGYGFESEIERNDKAFEWLINIPERRRYLRILVRGIEGEAELADLQTLQQSVDRERVDEGWLVSARRVSSAVRDKTKGSNDAKLFCYTFDELLDQNADFTKYLDWLEQEVQRQRINELFVPLAATKNELDSEGRLLGVSRYDRENGWLDGYIDRWLDDPSKEHVSILGEFGTGKTWFALHYASAAVQRYREARRRGVERPRLPLVIQLRDYAKAVSVESLFSEFFFRKHEIPIPGYSAFEKLNRMGKLLLIFDGFDEMAAKVDRQQMINNFWQLARVVVPGAKAILTCRTEHFPDAKEGRALLSAELKASTSKLSAEPPQFEVLELEKFDDGQVRELLGHRADPNTVEAVMENPQLRDLVRRPVMTDFILEALPDIEAGKPVDLSLIYLYAVSRKLERDIDSGRTFTSLADKLYFMCEVGWEMLSTDRMTLNYRVFPDHLKNLFGDIVGEQKDLDHWHYDMMRNTLLVRTSEGDYYPAHRSLLEFFVAYKFAAELGILASDFTDAARQQSNVDSKLAARPYRWSQYFRREVLKDGSMTTIAPLTEFETESPAALAKTFGQAPLSKAVLDLIEHMLSPDAESRLFKLAQGTRKAKNNVGLIGGNAVRLLLRLNPQALRDKDLTAAQLQHTVLTNADLTGCKLRGALLQDAVIRQTILEDVDMREADLTNAVFSDDLELASVSLSPDGKRYVFGFGGAVMVQEMWDGHDLFEIQHPRGRAKWSPDGLAIASGSRRTLGLWTSDGREIFSVPNAYENWVVGVAFSPDGRQIITGGGMEDFPLRVWDMKGQMLAKFPVASANQANQVSISNTGDYVISSFWDRRNEGALGVVLYRRSSDGSLSPVRDYIWHNWYICFCNCSSRFFAKNSEGELALFDAETGTLESFDVKGIPLSVSRDDSKLIVWGDEDVMLWHVPTSTRLNALRFGPPELDRGSPRYDFSNDGRVVVGSPMFDFSNDGSVVVGGWNDGTLRFWDARLFVYPDGGPQIYMREYSPPDLSQMSQDPATWPLWWQNSRIDVPEGMLPNPDFARELRVIDLKSNFKGLRLEGARGLNDVQIIGGERAALDDARSWLISRGAKL